jgi:hypothetical protein
MSLKDVQMFIETNAIGIGLVVLGIVFLLIVIFTIFKPKNTIESLIIEAEDIVEHLLVTKSAIQDYATDYVTTRKGFEDTVKGYVDSANGILITVKGFQAAAKDAHNRANTALTQSQTAVTNGQGFLTNTNNALTSIQNIVNGVQPISETAGSDFGSNMQKVLDLQTSVNRNYTESKQFLDTVSTNYTQAGQQEKLISDNLKNGNDQTLLLNSYIRQLLEDIKTSPQYGDLQVAIERAERLVKPLTDAIAAVTDTAIKNRLQKLLDNVNNSINTAKNYRDNIITLFTNATTNAGQTIAQYIGQLLSIFSTVVGIVGTLTFSGPYPFSVPLTPTPLPTGDNSILFYYNDVQRIYANIVSQYNTYITLYNGVINNVNSVQTLVNTNITGTGSAINGAVSGYNQAQNILRPYLTGTFTTMGPYTVPAADSPLAALPTVTPYSFTTIPPRLQGI